VHLALSPPVGRAVFHHDKAVAPRATFASAGASPQGVLVLVARMPGVAAQSAAPPPHVASQQQEEEEKAPTMETTPLDWESVHEVKRLFPEWASPRGDLVLAMFQVAKCVPAMVQSRMPSGFPAVQSTAIESSWYRFQFYQQTAVRQQELGAKFGWRSLWTIALLLGRLLFDSDGVTEDAVRSWLRISAVADVLRWLVEEWHLMRLLNTPDAELLREVMGEDLVRFSSRKEGRSHAMWIKLALQCGAPCVLHLSRAPLTLAAVMRAVFACLRYADKPPDGYDESLPLCGLEVRVFSWRTGDWGAVPKDLVGRVGVVCCVGFRGVVGRAHGGRVQRCGCSTTCGAS